MLYPMEEVELERGSGMDPSKLEVNRLGCYHMRVLYQSNL